ncbi:glucuronate isomerase [Paludibaculum fermentans]|uniref:Uronate isomerase n=1 Tax=Paludibaculum fermentans TaxID=1473598 RepID=A0A7S7NT30_PALFE|nr:glucuronate isomerase [Paludibaculum fermentans]QOY89201.1 glucuronate isomerase [Paludibaculum fermentans]
MPFIHEDFLLSSPSARKLYHEYAQDQPILDYHCHLPPRDVAQNRQFANLFEIWLEGDHYKWRAMRANGVNEELVTGAASPKDKFLAWAKTVPDTLRNPLYHWTHLELKRYFGIDELLDSSNAESVWARANEQLATDGLRAWGILDRFQVKAVCTTDDPTDDLADHQAIAASGLATKVYPTFRPDKAMNVHQPTQFNEWLGRLSQAANIDITGLPSFLDALKQRHDFFHSMGGRLSDHGINAAFAEPCSQAEAAEIFHHARACVAASAEDQAKWASFLMLFFGRLDAEKGWTKQLHLMARRSNNTRLLEKLGPDTGFDSIGDWPQMDALGKYLDTLDQENALPRTILYNLNPSWNYAFATMIGNFQDGSVAGKIQFGSGWWFLDQKEAMEWQMNALSNCGLLSRFVGMLTDSRSFMSYPRHEYFRRTLCNLLGDDMEKGLLPDSFELVGGMARNICFANARDFFGLAL